MCQSLTHTHSSLAVAVLAGVSALTIAAPAVANSDGKLVEGKMAKPLERRSPRYPKDELRQGREGWVLVNLVVGPDGRTRDAVVEDSEGGRAFERSALSAVRSWTYEPASLDGEPVEQCHSQVIVTFRLEDSPTGASRTFVRRYTSIAGLVRDGDLLRAKEELDALRPENLYEGAFRALLVADLARREGNHAATLSALRRAIVDDGRYLPKEAYQKALVTTFQLEARLGRLAQALATHASIEKVGVEDPALDEQLDALAEKIRAAIASGSTLVRRGELGDAPESDPLAMWYHRLSRSIVGLQNIEGELDHVELRCDFHCAASPPKEGTALRIPEEWGGCVYFVFGAPGARFDLVEFAASEVDAPTASDAASTESTSPEPAVELR